MLDQLVHSTHPGCSDWLMDIHVTSVRPVEACAGAVAGPGGKEVSLPVGLWWVERKHGHGVNHI